MKFTSTRLSVITFPENDWMSFHHIWPALKYGTQGIMTSLRGGRNHKEVGLSLLTKIRGPCDYESGEACHGVKIVCSTEI